MKKNSARSGGVARTPHTMLMAALLALALVACGQSAAVTPGASDEASTVVPPTPVALSTAMPPPVTVPTLGVTPALPVADVPGTVTDPCTLVTKEEAEGLLGEPVLNPIREDGEFSLVDIAGLSAGCRYTSKSSPTKAVAVGINRSRTGSASESVQLWEALKSSAKVGTTFQPVPGLGDDAYSLYVARTDTFIVYAKAGTAWLTISVRGMPNTAAAVQARSREAVRRLP